MRERGEADIAQDIEAVGDAMSRHVDRELARARVRGAARHRGGVSTALTPLVQFSDRDAVAHAGRRSGIEFEPHIAGDAQVPLDRTDLAEVLGNLLENAARHAAAPRAYQCRLGAGPSIVIEDDGARHRARSNARACSNAARGSTSVATAPASASPSCRTCSTPMAGGSIWPLRELGGLKATDLA